MVKFQSRISFVNPFSTSVPLLYLLKTSENLRFSDVFRGYRSGTLVKNRLMQFQKFVDINLLMPGGNKKDTNT